MGILVDLDDGFAVVGAQLPPVLLDVLDRWQERDRPDVLVDELEGVDGPALRRLTLRVETRSVVVVGRLVLELREIGDAIGAKARQTDDGPAHEQDEAAEFDRLHPVPRCE